MATILIIDDSEAVRLQLKTAFEAAGYQIAEGIDGNDGYNKLISVPNVKLVISDYNMPGMDGLTMLQKAKEKLGTFPFPVFLLTTETSETLKIQGKTIGITAWINKPFVAQKLTEAAKKVIKE
jgi:two-component system chemotaxis response regulator CheY